MNKDQLLKIGLGHFLECYIHGLQKQQNIMVDFLIANMNNSDPICVSGRKLMPKQHFRKCLPPTRIIALKIKLLRS